MSMSGTPRTPHPGPLPRAERELKTEREIVGSRSGSRNPGGDDAGVVEEGNGVDRLDDGHRGIGSFEGGNGQLFNCGLAIADCGLSFPDCRPWAGFSEDCSLQG